MTELADHTMTLEEFHADPVTAIRLSMRGRVTIVDTDGSVRVISTPTIPEHEGDTRAAAAALSGGIAELEPAIADALGALRAVAELALENGQRWKARALMAESAVKALGPQRPKQ